MWTRIVSLASGFSKSSRPSHPMAVISELATGVPVNVPEYNLIFTVFPGMPEAGASYSAINFTLSISSSQLISSLISRTNACSSVSPCSIFPPGMSHCDKIPSRVLRSTKNFVLSSLRTKRALLLMSAILCSVALLIFFPRPARTWIIASNLGNTG